MITVLIPMFNEEQTIVNQLSAIMVSNIPLKLLIVNDGSTDISLTICSKFISDYKSDNIRCKTLNKPHSGYSDTINFALRLIDTEYFTILDSDDTVDPKIFSVVCKLPNLSDYDLICWNSGMAQVQFSEKYQIFNYVATTNKIINDQYFGGYCWNKLYHTDIVRDNLLSFDSSIHFMSDKLFTVEYWLLNTGIVPAKIPCSLITSIINTTIKKKSKNINIVIFVQDMMHAYRSLMFL